MAVKRRIIWVDDDDWLWMRTRAANEGMTVSAFIRTATALAGPVSEEMKALFGPDESQAGAANLRAFNSRPFRPVPKRTK